MSDQGQGGPDPADRRRLLRSPAADAAARLRSSAGRVTRPGTASDEGDGSGRAVRTGRADYLTVKAELHERLLESSASVGCSTATVPPFLRPRATCAK